MAMDHIHIWPRNQYLIVAQPNPDKTFTAVFFAPLSLFRTLKTAEQVIYFFRQYFSDVLTLIETDTIVNTFFTLKPSPIIMTKCTEYLSSRGDMILMGDAAHSMAPFYGQGMNAAFEDCLVLFEHLQKNNFDLSKAFLAYKYALLSFQIECNFLLLLVEFELWIPMQWLIYLLITIMNSPIGCSNIRICVAKRSTGFCIN